MNEQLQKELALWLAQLRDAANHGTDFALAQAPMIVQEKLLYERVTSTAVCVVFLVLAVVMARLAPRLRTRWAAATAEYRAMVADPKRGYESDLLDTMFNYGIGFGLSVGVAFASAMLFLVFIGDSLKVWLAPRLYVLEWLASLLKGGQ